MFPVLKASGLTTCFCLVILCYWTRLLSLNYALGGRGGGDSKQNDLVFVLVFQPHKSSLGDCFLRFIKNTVKVWNLQHIAIQRV